MIVDNGKPYVDNGYVYLYYKLYCLLSDSHSPIHVVENVVELLMYWDIGP